MWKSDVESNIERGTKIGRTESYINEARKMNTNKRTKVHRESKRREIISQIACHFGA
jgi:hypothetical protein